MEKFLAAGDKYDIQQKYRRFQRYYSQGLQAQGNLKRAKASRIWILGVIALFFAMHSDFFMGIAFGVMSVYVYQILNAAVEKAQVDDELEDLERGFKKKGLKLEDATAFFHNDDKLEKPLNLMDDAVYQ